MDELKEQPMEKLRVLLHDAVCLLVRHKEDVIVTATQANKTTIYEIEVQYADRGKIIGKKGEMAKSLRHLATSISAANGFRSILEVCDVPKEKTDC